MQIIKIFIALLLLVIPCLLILIGINHYIPYHEMTIYCYLIAAGIWIYVIYSVILIFKFIDYFDSKLKK